MNTRMQAWSDQEDARVAATIRRYGWSIQYIGGGTCAAPWCDHPDSDGPPFAYTVGLFGLAHPELLLFGVPPDTAAGILNTLGERVRAGEALLPGQLMKVEDWPYRIVPEPVPNPGEIVFEANRFYQRPDEHSVAVLQLSYDDTRGRFPWEESFATPEMQPRPGTFQA